MGALRHQIDRPAGQHSRQDGGARAGAYEAWLVDRDGFVTEGSSTTAWIVDGEGCLVTRDLSNAILPGVTRRVALEARPKPKFRSWSAASRRRRRRCARGVSFGGVGGNHPIVAIDGKPVGDGKPGPVTRRLQELYLAAAAKKAGAEKDAKAIRRRSKSPYAGPASARGQALAQEQMGHP
jgi:branched-subunit amino acid aminotransferase/4-amino-4-deoxychorismate lyase